MNATTRKAARPDRTWISPLIAFKETATKMGHSFIKRLPPVTRVRANIEDSFIQ